MIQNHPSGYLTASADKKIIRKLKEAGRLPYNINELFNYESYYSFVDDSKIICPLDKVLLSLKDI